MFSSSCLHNYCFSFGFSKVKKSALKSCAPYEAEGKKCESAIEVQGIMSKVHV